MTSTEYAANLARTFMAAEIAMASANSEAAIVPRARAEKILDPIVSLRARSGSNEPPHQQDGAGAQRDAGRPVEDRQHGSELPAVDLKVRRERPVGGSHLQQFPALL